MEGFTHPSDADREFNELRARAYVGIPTSVSILRLSRSTANLRRRTALTSSVGATPRAFWGAYGASKAALETLMLAYAAENRNLGRVRVAIVDPGATATVMRARAFPGEDPATIKAPDAVGAAITTLLAQDFASGTRLAV